MHSHHQVNEHGVDASASLSPVPPLALSVPEGGCLVYVPKETWLQAEPFLEVVMVELGSSPPVEPVVPPACGYQQGFFQTISTNSRHSGGWVA